MMKTIVSLSGGMDSGTALGWLVHRKHEVQAVSFHYGSKHNAYEIECAKALAAHYGVPHEVIPLAPVMRNFKSDLLLSGGDIPEGHYTDETMSATVVPCRNLIMLSILAGLAESTGCDGIAFGIHQGDHAIYPDCREEFRHSAHETIKLATDGKVSKFHTPFLLTDKLGILKVGYDIGVPYELTRTCYKDQPVACGKCGSCVERLEAFQLLGKKDPVPYE